MSTVRATNITDLTGTYTSTTTAINRGIAKAWVNFDGTTASPSTIRASYNVSSITKNGTGDYTVNFTTALADANYAFASLVGSTLVGSDQFGSRIKAAPTTTSLNVASTYGNTLYDIPYFGIAIFR